MIQFGLALVTQTMNDIASLLERQGFDQISAS